MCASLSLSGFRAPVSQIRWSDQVAVKPVSSTRRFINTFFVDAGAEIEEAELAVRLPYDRVNITGSIPFTFLSNDVVRD